MWILLYNTVFMARRFSNQNGRMYYASLFFGALIALFIFLGVYFVLKLMGLEKSMNSIDKTIFVSWRRQGFYPKQYFKLFYNLSIIFIPSTTLFFAFLIEKIGKKSKKSQTKGIPTLQLQTEQKEASFLKKFYLLILVAMLSIVLINFGYLIETGIWVNYYHHNFIIATINDLFHGKHLLVDTFNQYGLFYPLFLYLIFKVGIPFSYMNFYLLLMIGTWIYFFILFFFLKELTKNTIYSLIGLYIIMGVNMLFNYSVYPYSENYVWPGGIPLRFFFDGLVFLLILRNKFLTSKKRNIFIFFILSIAFFYNIETGLSLVVSFVFLLFIYSISLKGISWIKRGVIFAQNLLQFLIVFIAIGLFFSLYTRMASGSWPRLSLFLDFVRLAQAGLNNAPTPFIGWYWLHIIIYFIALIIILHAVFHSRKKIDWIWYVTVGYSLYGLLLLNYYMSRSYNSNLTVVSIPALVLVIFLLAVSKKNQWIGMKIFRFVGILSIVVLVVISTFYLYKRFQYRLYALKEVIRAKKYSGNRGFIMVSWSETEGYTARELLVSIAKIKELTNNTNKIFLLSRYDVVLLIMAEKSHFIPYPMLEQIIYKNQLTLVKNNLVTMKEKPQYLFIDGKDSYKNDDKIRFTPFSTSLAIFETVSPYYKFVETVGVLDIYKLKEI